MSGKITVSSHLAVEQLRAFQAGNLAEEQIAEVEAHLQGCVACCDVLSGLPEDDFLLRVRCACENPPTQLQIEPSSTPPPHDTANLPDTPLETTASATPPLPGYEDVRELGRGGMGVVYAATHAVMGRRVAIKVIHPEFSSNPVAVERFRREVLAAARLSHPNIVTAYDAGEEGGRSFLVMEHLDGETLGDRLNRLGPLPVAEACDAVRQAALGVQHALDHGLIHRDVKPHNLMRTADGTIKVCDFGLASLLSDRGLASRATAPNAIMGTPDYMAPEQAENARSADGRADVYALGCTLYHLLTGHVPFPEESVLLKLVAHRTQTRPSAGRLRPEIPPELDGVLRRAMARKPANRYQTPGDFAKALEPFADPAHCSPRRHRRKRLLVLAALIFSLGVAIAGVVRLPTGKDRDVVIQTDDPEVEVVVKGDRIVRIVDPKTGKAYQLDRDDLTLGLADDPDGLTVTLDGGKPIVLKRRGQKIATVRLERSRNHSAGKEPEQPGEELRWSQGYKPIRRIVVSRDGRFAWTAGDDFSKWNLDTGERLQQIRAQKFAEESLPSPDGKMLLLAEGDGGGAELYDAATLKPIRSLIGSPSRLMQAVWLPDGRLLTGGDDFIARLWDGRTGKVIREFRGHVANIDYVDVNRDGTRILTFSCGERTVRVWNPDDGKELWRLSGHTGLALFSPDGRSILIGGRDGVIRRVAYPSGTILRCFRSPGRQEVSWDRLCMLPDGRHFLAAGSDRVLRLWDLETGREVYGVNHPGLVVAIAVTPDGRHALLGTDFGSILKWRLPPPRQRGDEVTSKPERAEEGSEVRIMGGEGRIARVYFLPDGEHVLAGGDSLTLWNIRTGEKIRVFTGTELRGWHLPMNILNIYRDGRYALAGFHLVDLKTGKKLLTLEGAEPHGHLAGVAFSPDGRRAVLGTDVGRPIGTLWVADLKTGKPWKILDTKQRVRAVAYSPDGTCIAAGHFNSGTTLPALRVYKAETGEVLHSLKVATEPGCIAFSPDGKQLVFTQDKTLCLWDLKTKKELKRFEGHTGFIEDVVFTPDGQHILSAGWDQAVRMWNLARGQQVACLRGHMDSSLGVSVAPDGRHVVTGCLDGLLRVWRLPKQETAVQKHFD